MDELEKLQLQKTTLIDVQKNDYKKISDVYYLNGTNIDKFIITVFFAEIGFVIHTISEFNLWYGIPILTGIIGVSCAFISYLYNAKFLSLKQDRAYLEMLDLIEFKAPDSDITLKEMFKSYLDTELRITILNYSVYFFLIITTVYSIIVLCFIKIKDVQPLWFVWSLFCTGLIALTLIGIFNAIFKFYSRTIQ